VRLVWMCELVSVFVISRNAIVAYAAVPRVSSIWRAMNFPSSTIDGGSKPSSLSSSDCARGTSGSVYRRTDHDNSRGRWMIAR
jgi:hypothetical protein